MGLWERKPVLQGPREGSREKEGMQCNGKTLVLESEDMGYHPSSEKITKIITATVSSSIKSCDNTKCQAGCEEQKMSEQVVNYLVHPQDSIGMQE